MRIFSDTTDWILKDTLKDRPNWKIYRFYTLKMALEIHSLMKDPNNINSISGQFKKNDMGTGFGFPISIPYIANIDRS